MTHLAESLFNARSFLEILAIDFPESSSSNHLVFGHAYYDEIEKSLWRCLSERPHSSPYSERQRMARIIKTRFCDADGDVEDPRQDYLIELREGEIIMRNIINLRSEIAEATDITEYHHYHFTGAAADAEFAFAQLAKATDILEYHHHLAEIRNGILTFKKIIYLENAVAKTTEIPDAELAELAVIISFVGNIDAKIAIIFSAFQMALIPFSQGLASVLHVFLLRLISARPRENNWSPKALFKYLQNIFKQAVSEECADMWVFLINKKLKKNWKPKELYFNQQECADMWAAYFVGLVLSQPSWLEKSYALSNSLPAKLYVCEALVSVYMSYQTRGVLDYCEKLKRYAMELQSNEYVLYSLIYSITYLSRSGNYVEAQTMLQGMEKQLNQTESVYQEYFFRGMAMSLHARLIFHQKGRCEEATVNIERGLELLKLVLNDPVYEPKTYINSPNASPFTRFWLTKEYIERNEKSLSKVYCKDLPSLVASLDVSSLHKSSLSLPSLNFVRGFANENPNQATTWANELVQKIYESAQNQFADSSSLGYAFDAYAEVITVTCTDKNELLSGEAFDKIEVVFNKLFPQKLFYTSVKSSFKFLMLCLGARAYDKAYQWLLKNVQTLMEVGFDDNSEARMSHLENLKLIFRMLIYFSVPTLIP